MGLWDRDREDNVLRYRGYIKKWAGINSIDPFLLGVLLHHEGGNYLDPLRRGAAQGVDYGKIGAGEAGFGTASVGVAGIQVSRAQEVLSSVYCSGGELSDFAVAAGLIESDEFSISIAAGYLGQLSRDYPAADNEGLFLAYAAGPKAIEAMDSFGWDIQKLADAVAVEAYIGNDPFDIYGISVDTVNTLLRRQEHWISSSNAMRGAGWP